MFNPTVCCVSTRHRYVFLDARNLEYEIDRALLTDTYDEIRLLGAAEAGEFDRQVIRAGRQVRDEILTNRIGDARPRDVRLHLPGGDGGAGKRSALLVGNLPAKRAQIRLRQRERRRQHQQAP